MHDNNYALQAENEVWELLAARDSGHTAAARVANDLAPVTALEAENGCDRCGDVAELYHNERTGLAVCGPCDTAIDNGWPVELDPIAARAAELIAEGRGNEPAFFISGEALLAAAEPELEPITWKRLRSGAWGIAGPAASITLNAVVTVTKRNGTTKEVRVARILWSGDGKTIATVGRV